MSNPTRPTGEQVRFRSAVTGDHILDVYLEAAEKGGRTLPDLLDDLFDSSGLFIRGSGLASWTGDYTIGASYARGDTYRHPVSLNLYTTLIAFTAGADIQAHVNDGRVALVLDASILKTYRDEAAASASAASSHKDAASTRASAASTSASTASTHKDAAAASKVRDHVVSPGQV
jgi:hypothetical protein